MINENYLKNLQAQHQSLEQKIKSGNARFVDDLAINTLKKQKLLLKQKIESLLHENA